MKKLKFDTDRKIESTDNNEYSEGLRDENLVEQDGWDSEIPLDDYIPDIIDETGEEDVEMYNEEGYRNIRD